MSKKRLLSRSEVDVDVWEERDRLSIVIRDKKTGQRTIAEWWDDDARQMFEDGFFRRGVELKRSVIAYAEEMGLIAKPNPSIVARGKYIHGGRFERDFPFNGKFNSKAGRVALQKAKDQMRHESYAGVYDPEIVARPNPAGAPNMVWTAYLSVALRRIYRVSAPRRISSLPGWVSIQTGTRLVIDALKNKFGAMDYHDPRVQTVIQMAKSMEISKNPEVRRNIFVFNNSPSGPADPTAVRELQLYIENDSDLYRQQFIPIVKNLMLKRRRGVYDREKAVKLFMYLMESGAKKYIKEFVQSSERGSVAPKIDSQFNRNTRLEAARNFRDSFETEAEYGNYDRLIGPVSNPRGVRKNIFAFNNSGRPLNVMEQAAASVGLYVTTWAPGDGQTRYRFFVKSKSSPYADYHQGDGLYTALGRKDAMAFIEAYRKGRSARANPPSKSVRTYRVPNGLEAQIASMLRDAFIWAQARDGGVVTIARPEIVERAIQYIQKHGYPSRNPLTRSEAGYLLRHARRDVLEAGSARRHGMTLEQKYHTGRARGIGFAVQETGPKAARKTWVDIHTRLDRTLRNPVRCNPSCKHAHGVCENPYGRGRERRSYQDFITRKRAEYGSKFDNSDLDPRFVSYYESGKRIWVNDFGHVTSGTVGVTTGWRPVFLLISSSRAMGSSTTLTVKTKILGDVGRYKPRRGEYGEAIENVRSNPLLQTIGLIANPPISDQWDRMSGQQRLHLLGFVGFPDAIASQYARFPWVTLSPSAKRSLERQWNDTDSGRRAGTTTRRRRIGVPVGANPLTRRESAQILTRARRDAEMAANFAPGHTRSERSGQAFARGSVVRQYGPSAAIKSANKVMSRAEKSARTTMSNPGALRLPAPGTKMTVAQAMDLARRIGDRGLIRECQAAAKLQTKANSHAKTVTWKHLPMGSKDKIDSVVALTHYGDSPEDMYRPPKGSKKGTHMYRHKWGDGTGRSKPVQVLASPSGKMIVKVMGPGQKVGDWMRG